jgi:hypothetical protein
MAHTAIRKLVCALARQGIDRSVVDAYFRLRDESDTRMHANLAALLPPPVRVRDESDPSTVRGLRSVK